MGKKVFVGVGDKAKRVKKIYVGVGDKAKRVLKAYVGVNGKAKLCFTVNVWEKWSVNYYTVTEYSKSVVESNVSEDYDPNHYFYLYSTWTVNRYTGQVTTGGEQLIHLDDGIGMYTGGGKKIKRVYPTEETPYYIYDQYDAVPESVTYLEKGSTNYGEVYGDEGDYPNNGYKNGYWYVRKY